MIDRPTPGSTLNVLQRRWLLQKNLALNVARLATGQIIALHLDCSNDPVQTMEKQETGKLNAPLS